MEAGDFATIVGSNGAGKSTLFNAITGGFIADEGSITLGDEDITFTPEYQRSRVIGHLFQDPLKGTAPNMTIEENLALAYLRAGTAPNAIFSRISRKDKEIFREKLALLDMGLEDRLFHPVFQTHFQTRQFLTEPFFIRSADGSKPTAVSTGKCQVFLNAHSGGTSPHGILI